MTITQRIELRRLGYSKEEIADLAELEKTPEPEAPAEPEQVETPAPEAPAEPQTQSNYNELLNAINNLTLVLQNQKLVNTPQPDPAPPQTSTDIFNSILKG